MERAIKGRTNTDASEVNGCGKIRGGVLVGSTRHVDHLTTSVDVAGLRGEGNQDLPRLIADGGRRSQGHSASLISSGQYTCHHRGCDDDRRRRSCARQGRVYRTVPIRGGVINRGGSGSEGLPDMGRSEINIRGTWYAWTGDNQLAKVKLDVVREITRMRRERREGAGRECIK